MDLIGSGWMGRGSLEWDSSSGGLVGGERVDGGMDKWSPATVVRS
jgi:hypothetical protein